MVTKRIRKPLAAAVLALAGLGFAAPAMAAPLAPDAGLRQGQEAVVAVQYGHGDHHHGFGHRRGHHHHDGFGPGRGHHYGWRHRGFGHHHHHGHRGRHHGHW